MKFKYTICFPDKSEVQQYDETLEAAQVLENASKYPWRQQLDLANKIGWENVHYNPSLEFINTNTNHSFTLTASYDKSDQLTFSLWYNRPKLTKVLFGILGEKEKMVVEDAWGYSEEEALKYLEHFVNGRSNEIEKIYK